MRNAGRVALAAVPHVDPTLAATRAGNVVARGPASTLHGCADPTAGHSFSNTPSQRRLPDFPCAPAPGDGGTGTSGHSQGHSQRDARRPGLGALGPSRAVQAGGKGRNKAKRVPVTQPPSHLKLAHVPMGAGQCRVPGAAGPGHWSRRLTLPCATFGGLWETSFPSFRGHRLISMIPDRKAIRVAVGWKEIWTECPPGYSVTRLTSDGGGGTAQWQPGLAPWKVVSGDPPAQEAHRSARIFIVPKALTASLAGQGTWRPLVQGRPALPPCSAVAARIISGGCCRRPVLLSSVPEAAQWIPSLRLLGGKVTGQLPKWTPTLTSGCCCHLARPYSPPRTEATVVSAEGSPPSPYLPPHTTWRTQRAMGTEKRVLLCQGSPSPP